jgi:hypothetical protein
VPQLHNAGATMLLFPLALVRRPVSTSRLVIEAFGVTLGGIAPMWKRPASPGFGRGLRGHAALAIH